MGNKKNEWIPLVAVAAILGIALLFATGILTMQGLNLAPKTDLRNLFSPYNLGELETLCKSLNGDWHQETGWVGCTAVQGTTVNCNMPLLIAIRDQCNAVDATYYCDSGNAYCKY